MYPIKLKAHERNINILRFNYDGDLIFSGDADRVINVFEAYTGQRLGSYATKTSVKTLDVDINSNHLLYAGFDGTVQMFEVKTGKSIFHTNFPNCKFMQLQFALASKKFFLLEAGMNSSIKIVDFQNLLTIKPDINEEIKCDQIKLISKFDVTLGGQKRLSQKGAWYVDNKSIFIGTLKGEIIHYSEDGSIVKDKMVHPGGKIKAVTFSKDFSILATAASDGCKILDPQNLQVLRFFKQQVPMNAVSVSPLFATEKEKDRKYHVIVGGGIPAIYAAMSKTSGFDAHICNVMDGKEIGKLLYHFGPINAIQFFKDGRGFVSAGEDGYLVIIRFDDAYFDNPKFQ